MNPLPDESPIEIEARAILIDFNHKLHKYLINNPTPLHESIHASCAWIGETLQIMGTALGWALVKKTCLYWQEKFDELFDRISTWSVKLSLIYNDSMGWSGKMTENEEIIADILDFSRFGIETGFLRQEVKKRTEVLLQQFIS